MSITFARGSVLVCVAALTVSVGTSQPPSPAAPEPQPTRRATPWVGPPLSVAPAPRPAVAGPGLILLDPKVGPSSPTPLDRADYTAFPDLKPPTVERKEVRKADGTVEIVIEEKGAVPLPELPPLAD